MVLKQGCMLKRSRIGIRGRAWLVQPCGRVHRRVLGTNRGGQVRVGVVPGGKTEALFATSVTIILDVPEERERTTFGK